MKYKKRDSNVISTYCRVGRQGGGLMIGAVSRNGIIGKLGREFLLHFQSGIKC